MCDPARDGILSLMRRTILTAVLLCCLTPAMLVGDVVDSASNGFSIKIGTVIQAGPVSDL